MAEFYSVLTTAGKAALLNAAGLGTTVTLTEMAVGDGDGSAVSPTEDMEALVNEVYRADINALEVDDESTMRAELVVPTTEGGFYVREVGIFDSDGILFAVANLPDTYKPATSEGAGRELTIVLLMEITDSETITLKIDPTIVLASRQYVDDGIVTHDEDPDAHGGIMPGQATTEAQGLVELATNSESVTGEDTQRAVTPAALAAVLLVLLETANTWSAAQAYDVTDNSLTIDDGVVTWNLAAKPVAVLTLTEDVDTITVTNATPGCSYELTVVQDATGFWTVDWPSTWLWPGGSAPDVTEDAGAEDLLMLSARDNSGTTIIRAAAAQAFAEVS